MCNVISTRKPVLIDTFRRRLKERQSMTGNNRLTSPDRFLVRIQVPDLVPRHRSLSMSPHNGWATHSQLTHPLTTIKMLLLKWGKDTPPLCAIPHHSPCKHPGSPIREM